MSSLEKFKHEIHIWERSTTNKTIYRCIHPDCPTYKPKWTLKDKRAECPKCHEFYILTTPKLRLKRPTCNMCSKSPKAKLLIDVKDFTEQMIGNLELPDDLKSILE